MDRVLYDSVSKTKLIGPLNLLASLCMSKCRIIENDKEWPTPANCQPRFNWEDNQIRVDWYADHNTTYFDSNIFPIKSVNKIVDHRDTYEIFLDDGIIIEFKVTLFLS